MAGLGKSKLSQYDLLVSEYFNLSRRMAKISAAVSDENLLENERYVRLAHERSEIKRTLDSLVSDFEITDFHDALRRMEE